MMRSFWAKYVWVGNGILALIAGILLTIRGGFAFPGMLGVLLLLFAFYRLREFRKGGYKSGE
ncbi:MAG: hypothetical protein ACK4G3_00450 [bacterium]